MNASNSNRTATAHPVEGRREPSAWWRYPIWWMVVGGPLTVVVAALVTAVIAVRGQDPVLDTRVTSSADDASAVARDRAKVPALVGRNHAASPNPAPELTGAK